MPDSYLVLARKWRPQRFEDLLGQGHVARTLANAIRSGRVAHAFLFAGVRGVGKTSAARILAKALTCRRGPTPEPCGECDACVGVTGGTATDVQEIDGASNNSVEDVRRLRENIAYQPSSLRFKIYIIDEVHMLSTSAFNALLKTLEEPPPHVKFIFATTEPHKIPTTILSRCQRYDFRRIATRQIAARLDQILQAENCRLPAPALRAIAEEAAGSMRDALSLLDQVLAAHPDGASADDVTWLLGVTPHSLIQRAAAAVVDRNPRAALDAVREADDTGYDLQQFARALLRYFRDLVVLASCPDSANLTDLADAEEAAAREIARRTTVPHLHRLFGLASRLVDELARSPLPRAHADVALARMATADVVVPLADILARLERLPGGRDGAGPSAEGRPSVPPAALSGPSSPSPARPAGRSRGEPSDDVPPPDYAEAVGVVGTADVVEGTVRKPVALMPEASDFPAVAAAEVWQRVVAEVGRTDALLGGMLAQAVPVALSAERVRLAFPEGSTAAELLRQPRRAETLAAVMERVVGGRPRLEVDDASSEAARAVAERAAARQAAEARARLEMMDHPAVREALETFAGSRVVEVRTGAGKGAGQR